MSKIKMLKGYLTVAEAAEALSTALRSSTSEADVLGAALSGALKLSVYLVNGSYAKRCKVISHQEALEAVARSESLWPAMVKKWEDGLITEARAQKEHVQECGGINEFLPISATEVLAVLDEIVELPAGTYDLPIVGNEKHSVERAYSALTDSAPPGLATANGVLVTGLHGGEYYQLHSVAGARIRGRQIFYPAGQEKLAFWKSGLMHIDAEFVVRSDNFLRFQETIRGSAEDLSDLDPPTSATKTLAERSVMSREKRKKLGIHGERGARRRILENWEGIEAEYGASADGRRVQWVLARDKDEEEISLKTIQNRLIELRKEGLIP